MKYEVKPSDVYSAAAFLKNAPDLLKRMRAEIVDFRPPTDSDHYLVAPLGDGISTGPHGLDTPRFIMQYVAPLVPIDNLPALTYVPKPIKVTDVYPGLTSQTLVDYCRKHSARFVEFRALKQGDWYIPGQLFHDGVERAGVPCQCHVASEQRARIIVEPCPKNNIEALWE